MRADLTRRLCQASLRNRANPYEIFAWPETLDHDSWFTSPELISLHGTPIWEALPQPQQKRLSFWEAVNFYSLNARGEKQLVEGLAQRLYRRGNDGLDEYLHHFLDEENKHMVVFATFCGRYGGKLYAHRKMTFAREYAPGEEDFLFFAKVLLFEEIVDVFNTTMARDERVAPIARAINAYHHRDESRHLVFGRNMVRDLFVRSRAAWDATTLRRVRGHLEEYLRSIWVEYCNPDAYADAGLEDPYGAAEVARTHPACRARQLRVSQPAMQFLMQAGILEQEPKP